MHIDKNKFGNLKSCNYYAIFSLFIAGSVAGFILEGIWCVIYRGYWESHSALLLGPFCVIYGIGAVAVYVLAFLLPSKNILIQFVLYTFAGAVTEYISSLFQEICFGSVSWDYSHHFMNLGGRVSLKMAGVLGILGIIFIRLLFPRLKQILSKIQARPYKIIVLLFTVWMVFDVALSSVALIRWHNRQLDIASNYRMEQMLDKYCTDEQMQKCYPNMEFIENTN